MNLFQYGKEKTIGERTVLQFDFETELILDEISKVQIDGIVLRLHTVNREDLTGLANRKLIKFYRYILEINIEDFIVNFGNNNELEYLIDIVNDIKTDIKEIGDTCFLRK